MNGRIMKHKGRKDNETKPTEGGQNLLECEHLLDCLYVSCTQKESAQHSTVLQISTEPEKSMNRSRCFQLTDILLGGWKKSKMYTDCLPKTAEHSKPGTCFDWAWKKSNNHGGRLQPASELIKVGIRF